MANRYSQNLPEVVLGNDAPEPLTTAEAHDRMGLDEGDQKYTVIYDLKTPKVAAAVPAAFGEAETPTSPAPAYRPTPEGAAVGYTAAAGATAPDVESLAKSEAPLVNGKGGGSKIMGLKRRTFFIVLVVVILVVAAAIGGGVGGSQAVQQQSSRMADSAEAAEAKP